MAEVEEVVTPVVIGDGRAYGRPPGTSDEELVQVGPGTPGGELLRRYWHPVATSAELRDLPVAVRVLGEDLVVFRDLEGRAGLVHNRCCHRGTTLFYGRVEPTGIRCCYHGWLFDVEGNCLEQPCEPEGGRRLERYRQPWYPVEERYGLVFAYLGPAEEQPVLPRYDLLEDIDPAYELIIDAESPYKLSGDPNPTPYNWLQRAENAMDPFHVYILHNNMGREQFSAFFTTRPDVTWEFTETGMKTSAVRPGPDGKQIIRVNQTFFPNVNVVGDVTAGAFDRSVVVNWKVPEDDGSCRAFFLWHMRAESAAGVRDGSHGAEMLGKQWYEMTEEEHQRTPFDYEAQVGQGVVTLHSEERLASSDRGVVMFRSQLRRNIRAVAAGQPPMNVHRSAADAVLPIEAGNFLVDQSTSGDVDQSTSGG